MKHALPLIISGPASEDVEWYSRMAAIVRQLNQEDYDFDEKDRSVALTEIGEAHVEDLLQIPLRDPERPEDITPEQARLLGHLEQALKALLLFKKNKDYIIQNGEIIIVDEFTGRLMPGRRWSEGLHQAVEAKEGVKVKPENITHATITLQNYFRKYEKLAGMTGTALTEAEEFSTIYNLEAVEMPTNLDYEANQPDSQLEVLQDKDEEGFSYTYYTLADDNDHTALYWKRKDYHDVVYRTEEAKIRAIVLEILKFHIIGRPVLVGTTSIEHSERLSSRLQSEYLGRLLMTLLIRDAWFKKNNISTPERVIPELAFLNEPLQSLKTDKMRRFANSIGLISINPESPENMRTLLEELSLKADDLARLEAAIRGGIPHEVLNARKHDQESQIIAGAGAFGAVTIATNMAGRGVDIKLGGEINESILSDIRHFLNERGIDPYGLSNAELADHLKEFSPDDYGEYIEAIQSFITFLENSDRVRPLGGLHVIGSERHEARRIDNQLRGRAARQGDPGSSRFYLSLEDDLMRMFGGERAENLMRVFNIDPSIPLESKMLGRLVEQAQERVEGHNFDVRKHLLDYDDVLNDQRERIYSERDRVLVKEDLEEDVLSMLRTELQKRIPDSLADEEGPWKLLAFLEEIQPTVFYPKYDDSLPSYTLSLIHKQLEQSIQDLSDPESIRKGLLDLAEKAVQAESGHVLNQTRAFIQRTAASFNQQISERMDLLDIFLENNLDLFDQSPKDFLNELQNQVHLKINLDSATMQALKEAPRDMANVFHEQVEQAMLKIVLSRLIMTIERRINGRLAVNTDELADSDWVTIEDKLIDTIEKEFQEKNTRIRQPQSQIQQNITSLLKKQQESSEEFDLFQLASGMTAGTQVAIDPRTRKRVNKRINLINYIYLAALQAGEYKSAEDHRRGRSKHIWKGSRSRCAKIWGRTGNWNASAENIPAYCKDLPKEGYRKIVWRIFISCQMQKSYLKNIRSSGRCPWKRNQYRRSLTASAASVQQTHIPAYPTAFHLRTSGSNNSPVWKLCVVSIGMEAYAQLGSPGSV